MSDEPCVSCGRRPTRQWSVEPVYLRRRYGGVVAFCDQCEPFTGEPLIPITDLEIETR